jgi:histidinol phosphatase-like PHP family hydrolase
MVIKSVSKKLAKKISYLIAFVVILSIALLQSSSSIKKQKTISPSEMKLARDSVKNVMDKLASYRTFVEFTFSNQDLDAISKLGTHLLPKTSVMINTSRFGLSLSSSTSVSFLGGLGDYYINSRCLLVNNGASTIVEECQVGNLPIPSFLVDSFMNGVIYLVMGEEVSNTYKKLLAGAQYNDDYLTLKAKKSKYFREEVNASINKVGDLASYYAQSSSVSPELVQIYINELTKVSSINLSDYFKALFTLAAKRSKNSNAVEENTAIIWAVAVVFGDYRFASLIGMQSSKRNIETPLLRGRDDLTKHFIYSAALQQLGDVNIGFSIGEAKELLDSVSGGSGFSFADLAADKAGLKFAEYITSSNNNAEQVQHLLKNIADESTFFPFIHDLPEGFSGGNFTRVIDSSESESYVKIATEVEDRINKLALYSENQVKLKAHEDWSKPEPYDYKMWLKADTHIHTNFSDGNVQVDEVAKQAMSYGCNAIAITDHGDHNLKKVVSDEYFSTIKAAQNKYPYLTIMPGLEWNIPPMNGREHATLILPKTTNSQRNLSAFRTRYDHYKRFDKKVLSPKNAFQWLDKYGHDNSNYKPLVIYNHPSRKDWQQQENEHDFTYWRNFSDLVIGFSGAPGHQKKRSDNNGSYELHSKTINGWDPSIENIGGEWDRLLQQGYKIWAARAGSDFHNTTMDYWPCQFSSTHLLADSREHNDILAAYQSGAFWAQHGNFINTMNFDVVTAKNKLDIGQQGQVNKGEVIKINIEAQLNKKDWQGNVTSLNELELIIITEKKIDSIKFSELNTENKQIKIVHQYKLDSKFAIFRWRGKSLQPELHQYMFYTNPIKIIALE